MIKKIKIAKIIFVLISIMIIFGCKNEKHSKLKLGLVKSNIANFPVLVAANIKILDFDKIHIKYYGSEEVLNKALIRGYVDLAILPFTYTWIDAQNGFPIKSINNIQNEGDGILSHKSIENLESLNSKKIGIISNERNRILFKMFNKKHQLNLESIEYKNYSKLLSALQKDKIDAAIYNTPDIFRYTDDFHILHWFRNDFPYYPNQNLLLNTSYNRNYLNDFIFAISQSVTMINTSPKFGYESVGIIYEYKEKIAQQVLRNTNYGFSLNKRQIENEKKFMKSSSIKITIDEKEIFD